MKHKVSPKQASDEFWDNFEAVLKRGNDMLLAGGALEKSDFARLEDNGNEDVDKG